jgi:amino acid adenylation domain-containing protein
MSLDTFARSAFRAGDLIPLTWQQRVIWYQSILEPDSTRYHCHALFHFERSPDPVVLNQELRRLACRHRLLLTRLAYRNGEPYQVYPDVADADLLSVDEVQLAQRPSTSAELVAKAGANRMFDLQAGPLFRWTLARLPSGNAVLIHTEHHLVHDGISLTTLVNNLTDDAEPIEVDDAYFAYAAAQDAGPHPDAAAIANEFYPAATRHLPRRDQAARCDQPAGRDPALRLPVPAALVAAARATAKTVGTSLFTVLFTAFAESVYRSLGPVVMGTAVANRPAGHECTVGMFVSTVPVFIGDDARMSPRAVSAVIDAAVRRSDVPIIDVVAALPAGFVDRHGLVSVGFSLHEQHGEPVVLGGVRAEMDLEVPPTAAKFPVNVVALVDSADRTKVTMLIAGQAEYVDRDQLWGLWTGFANCLAELCHLPRRKPVWREPVPADVITAVQRIAAEDGALVALRDENTTVSYAELVALGDNARWCGGSVVGLLGNASARFFAAAYAVVHAGGTYVPLDVRQPTDRLAYMIQRSGCQIVVDLDGSGQSSELTGLTGARHICWDRFRSPGPATGELDPAETAYIIFTSGSAGTPKGVRVRRTSLAWLCDWAAATLGFGPGTITSQVASVGFDAAVWELWPALYSGAELVVAPDQVRGDPIGLVEWLAAHRVEVAFAPTPMAEMLMNLPWPEHSALRVLGAGGDQLHLPGRALPFELINLYGPTECTVVSAAQRVDPRDSAPPPIGTAPPYCTAAVIAEDGSRVPDGCIGELWLGGPGVADGYAAAPELTLPRFVPDPHSPDGAIVYRTGDLVRRDHDGTLTFCGRQDRQVKVSGIRIELAEVEATALRQPEAQQAIAMTSIGEQPIGTVPGNGKLSLIVIPAPGADEPALAERIRDSLPTYLRHVPIRFVPALPLNSHGKVNQRMLSTLLSGSESAASSPGEENAREAALALARATLQTGEIGTPWFSAGGSSLDAARLVTRLTLELGLSATVRQLLEASSVEAYLAGLPETAPSTPADDTVPGPDPVRAPSPHRIRHAVTPHAVTAQVSAAEVLWPSMSDLPPDEKLRLASLLVGAASADIWPG